MKSSTKCIVSTVLLALVALVLVIGGILKLTGSEPASVMTFLTAYGFADFLVPLGLSELVLAALLLYPATRKIGFLLVCSYFGGALCLEISGREFPASALFLVIAWAGMFLGDRTVFLQAGKTE